MQQLFEDRSFQLVEQFPLHHTGAVSVAQDALAYLVGDPSREARRFKRKIHTFNCQRAHGQDTHLVAEIEPHRRRWFAPRSDHIESRFFGQHDFADRHFAAVGVRQLHRVQPLEKCGF